MSSSKLIEIYAVMGTSIPNVKLVICELIGSEPFTQLYIRVRTDGSVVGKVASYTRLFRQCDCITLDSKSVGEIQSLINAAKRREAVA